MRAEFWEGKIKHYEADLPEVPVVGDGLTLPSIPTIDLHVAGRRFVASEAKWLVYVGRATG